MLPHNMEIADYCGVTSPYVYGAAKKLGCPDMHDTHSVYYLHVWRVAAAAAAAVRNFLACDVHVSAACSAVIQNCSYAASKIVAFFEVVPLGTRSLHLDKDFTGTDVTYSYVC